ncbi:glycoside hydrolase family 43 protein [Deinococcus pimensis]|uniref:glycoside hydrolase family 43 protein n=1 Tax=Deinococcus pimensis TaxID=309888 RepID=UPI0004B73670|nr:glycoside hydrolase family 43 protein [Deinococcus pimensis]
MTHDATLFPHAARATGNPVLPGWHADPELHHFDGRYYLYPTRSLSFDDQKGFDAWSSEDLTHWRPEGCILDLGDVAWSTNRAAWAPSVTHRDGRYYLYFSAGDGAGIGVAVADHPAGPFRDVLSRPLVADWPFGAQPIDANVFQDDDGQAILYFGGHNRCAAVKLGTDLVSLDGPYVDVTPDGYTEGPFMFKRRGTYYFLWSEGVWMDDTYAVAYARARHPFGPFHREGRILTSDPAVGTGAGHNSVLRLPGTDAYVIAYHRRPVTETHHDHRVVCIDELTFDADGRILPVQQTFEGVPPHRPPRP